MSKSLTYKLLPEHSASLIFDNKLLKILYANFKILNVFCAPVFPERRLLNKTNYFMAKESMAKENPVIDALRKLKEEEAELLTKLKPLQEAVSALEKIVEKTVKKTKPSSGAKDGAEENGQESSEDAQ
jgi:hypothetical protein